MTAHLPIAFALSACILVAGCAPEPSVRTAQDSYPPRPAQSTSRPPPSGGSAQYPYRRGPATAVPQRPSSRPGFNGYGHSSGNHGSRFVTGDYAGYPALDRFIEKMAGQYGFSRDYLASLFSEASRKDSALKLMGPGKPSSTPPRPGGWSRYRAKFLTERHISTGASFWSKHAAALNRAYSQYGVPPEYIMGIMGVETVYGGNMGNFRVLDALTTLAFDYPRRSAYFTDELEKFLVMTRNEDIDPTEPRGSFAGAMGLGQFMPGSFLDYAVDFDGDGRRDLWNPDDAIGSVANYFARHGWRHGEPVVSPAVVASPGANALECGLDTHYALASLANYGIRPATPYRSSEPVRLLRLSTESGDEYWLGYNNFYVITRYNHSTHYAMAVHALAQAVKQRYMQTVAAR